MKSKKQKSVFGNWSAEILQAKLNDWPKVPDWPEVVDLADWPDLDLKFDLDLYKLDTIKKGSSAFDNIPDQRNSSSDADDNCANI